MNGLFHVSKDGSTFEQIQRVVSKVLAVPSAQVTPESRFEEDLSADSLDSLELIMAFEEHFEVEISDDQATGLTTAGLVDQFIRENYPKMYVTLDAA